VSSRSPTLTDVVATLQVDQIDDDGFVATQLDNPGHHIVGGHIAGQALMSARRYRVDRVTWAKLNCQRSTMWKPSRCGTWYAGARLIRGPGSSGSPASWSDSV
jgi:hypothetical protein